MQSCHAWPRDATLPALVFRKAAGVCAAELKSCALSDAQSKKLEPGVEETHDSVPHSLAEYACE